MDANRFPPPVVTNGAPSPVERNNGMNRVPAPVGFNRGPPPMGQGPLPLYFNRGPPPMEMAGPQPYIGFNRGPPPPFRGPPPFGLNREPPPLGFSTPPPPRGAPPPPGTQMPLGSSPQLGHSNVQFDNFSNIPQAHDQLPGHLQSTDDGNGSTQSNLLPPHLHHNPPKRTFQGEHFTVNDFIQPPPSSSVYPPIPHSYQGCTNISSQQYYNKGHNTSWHGGPSPNSSNSESSTYQTIIEEETDGLDEDQKWINNFEQRILQRCQVQPARKNLPTNAVKVNIRGLWCTWPHPIFLKICGILPSFVSLSLFLHFPFLFFLIMSHVANRHLPLQFNKVICNYYDFDKYPGFYFVLSGES